MQLRDNLVTDTGWEIREESFNEELLINNGSNFMTGNGYLGYRGTLPEWRADQYVGCFVTDTYDNADGKWEELASAPNGLYVSVSVDGREVSALGGETIDYSRELSFRYGRHARRMSWSMDPRAAGAEANVATPAASAPAESAPPQLTLEDERFASYGNIHLMAARHRLSAHAAGRVTIHAGIDGEVWSLHGEHFRSCEPSSAGDDLYMKTITGERQIGMVVSNRVVFTEGPEPAARELVTEDRGIFRRLDFDVAAGTDIAFELYCVIYTSNDLPDPAGACARDLDQCSEKRYPRLWTEHTRVWDGIWDCSRVDVDGDELAQVLLRYNIYHNVIATPAHTDHLPIGARGLSCQAYQGAAFWDQEIFNLPMFVYTRPDVARRILIYRYKTLDGARRKARRLGYYGAFYAWVSSDTGDEICPSYFFKDVLTGRDIRNHFNDWQIHISPDIAYAVWNYYLVTGDWAFMRDYGAEMLFEIAQFLVSRVHFKRDKHRYEFIRLLGPDEYHENVDNNTFTAVQARYALRAAVNVYVALGDRQPELRESMTARLGIEQSHVDEWRRMVELIHVNEPDLATGVIEQFDGFFDHEDITPDALAERLIDPGEYWGWPNGIAVPTQVSKQADVCQIFTLHRGQYSTEVMKANYDYYEPRTQHGSSLSPSVYGTVASWIGYTDTAREYLVKSSAVDLFNTNKSVSGGTFIGGIHTAACGAAWQMVVFGFCGLELEGETLRFRPHLPESWASVSFFLEIRGALLDVEVASSSVTVTSRATSRSGVGVVVGNTPAEEGGSLEPAESVTLTF
ncbi:MAG: glycoside hydrolase family 65 protein [Spirochaetes bacterium]|jgi:kojibiose phosphorylase|nr:glycoside hydrolase family 65 protein [Spirochaetota bacterium]